MVASLAILYGTQGFKDGINGMVVVGGEQHGLVVEICRDNGIQYRIGLASAGRALYVGHRIVHGIINGKQLVKIHLSVEQCYGRDLFICFHLMQLSEECTYWS